MVASISDTHYVSLGDSLTACGEPASGRNGVMLRSHIASNVTCRACRACSGFRGHPTKAAKNVAEAGRVIARAISKYGDIGHHQRRTR